MGCGSGGCYRCRDLVVVEYVGKSTGATLPVVDMATQQAPAGRVLVYIGRSEYVDRKLGKELDKLDL